MIKSVNLTEEQIAKLNELQIQDNRSASVIVGMAIDYYYDMVMNNEKRISAIDNTLDG